MLSKMFTSVVFLAVIYTGRASAVECCKVNPTTTYNYVRVSEINCVYGQKMSQLSFMSNEHLERSGLPTERSLQIQPDLCAKVLSQAVAAADCMHNVTANIHTETVNNIEYIRAVDSVQIVGTICR